MKDTEFIISIIPRKKGIKILELGVEWGISTMQFAKFAAELSGSVVAIDHWQGTPLIREQFMEAYRLSKYRNILTICEGDLFEQVDTLAPQSFDVIFFDAVYYYPQAKQMITAYLPKLKKGGLAIGHGADFYWSSMPERTRTMLRVLSSNSKEPVITVAFTDESINCLLSVHHWRRYFIRHPERRDNFTFEIHSGLALSLFELFADDYNVNSDHTTWWRYNE